MEKYIDTHAHYNARQFKNNLNLTIEKIKECTQFVINCGTNNKEIENTIKLVNKYENIYGVIGYFPSDVLELTEKDAFPMLEKQLKYKKILGIGEIGLDYYHDAVDRDLQKEMFNKQIDLANKLKIPVCIHSRDAEDDTLKILKNNTPQYGCSIHCFSYGKSSAKQYYDMGFYFGVGGTCTYERNKELRDAIKDIIPLDKILLETDAPYLSPSKNRTRINDSTNIKYVVQELSELKNINEDEIVKRTNQNVFDLYKRLGDYFG